MKHSLNKDKEALIAYLEQKVSKEQSHQMEVAEMDDPFLADAIDGLSQMDVRNAITELDQSVGTRIHQGGSFWKYLITPGIALLGIFSLLQPSGTHSEEIPHHNTTAIHQETEPSEVPTTIAVGNEQTENSPIVTENYIRPAAVVVETPEENSIAPPPPIEVMDTKPTNPIEGTASPNMKPKTIKHPVYYLYDYKVANYKGYRSNQLMLHTETNSLSAQYESKGQQTLDISDKTVRYTDYLDETMKNLASGKKDMALDGLKIILKHYPDDANALFYSGLALFRDHEYQKAIPFFTNSDRHILQVFDEESEWHLAQCYYQVGEIKKAKKLLNKIIEEQDFYQEKARKFLANKGF